MRNSKLLSIIIVNYNTGKFLLDCVKSIYSGHELSGFEIIIIDNASSDDSLIQLKKEYPHILLVNNKENLGFGKAVNQGIKIANNKFILLLNPDTIISSGCFDKMIAFLRNNPKAGACGPAIYNSDKNLQMSCHHFPGLLDIVFDKTHLNKIFSKNPLFGRYQMSYWAHDTLREVDWLTGACFMIRAELFRAVNGFDPGFFMFSEDIDLCLRIKQKGFKCFYLPQATIIHYQSGSSDVIKNKSPVIAWESLILFWQKHHNPFSLLCLKIILTWDAWLKIAILNILFLTLKTEKHKNPVLAEIAYFKQVLTIIKNSAKTS
ncbi:MAG: glycosyltransferase family 2 protein [Candidatus Omnitrophota bacterium]